jgi:NAD(P)-dependent dehydrogenase (short-subunit alcohol dehydrogenase family)
MKPLSGQTALITGAVRRIGRATALELSELGAAIVINARSSREEALAVQQEIQAAGGRAIVCLGDIRDEVFVSQMIEQTIEAFGRLDLSLVWDGEQVLYFDRYTRILAPGLNVLEDERLSMNRGPPPQIPVEVEVLPPE